MSAKTHGKGSSIDSEGIGGYLETQSIGVGLALGPVVDSISTRRDPQEEIVSRMSMENM
jgi:hypothetical protein